MHVAVQTAKNKYEAIRKSLENVGNEAVCVRHLPDKALETGEGRAF